MKYNKETFNNAFAIKLKIAALWLCCFAVKNHVESRTVEMQIKNVKNDKSLFSLKPLMKKSKHRNKRTEIINKNIFANNTLLKM